MSMPSRKRDDEPAPRPWPIGRTPHAATTSQADPAKRVATSPPSRSRSGPAIARQVDAGVATGSGRVRVLTGTPPSRRGARRATPTVMSVVAVLARQPSGARRAGPARSSPARISAGTTRSDWCSRPIVAARPGDDEEQAGLRRERPCACRTCSPRSSSTERAPGSGVEHGAGRHALTVCSPQTRLSVVLLARSAHHERRGDRDAELEVVDGAGRPRGRRRRARRWRGCVGCRGTAGRAARRRGPTSASARGAGRRRGTYSRSAWKARSLIETLVAGHALEVAHLARGRARRRSTIRGRTKSSSGRSPPDSAAEQPERVGAHGDGRPDVEHAARAGRRHRRASTLPRRRGASVGIRSPPVGASPTGDEHERLPQREPASWLIAAAVTVDGLAGRGARRAAASRSAATRIGTQQPRAAPASTSQQAHQRDQPQLDEAGAARQRERRPAPSGAPRRGRAG